MDKCAMLKQYHKYQNKNVTIETADGKNDDGIYLGSWKQNHFTFIVYSHQKKMAAIRHLKFESVKALSNTRTLEPEERLEILQYLSFSHN